MAESLDKKKSTRPDGDGRPTAGSQSVTISDIEKLFSLMSENEIAELKIEQHRTKIHIVSKGAPTAGMMQYPQPGMQPMQMMPFQNQPASGQIPQAAASPQNPPAQPANPDTSTSNDTDAANPSLPPGARTVLSPMVGTFYRSPSPESPFFVNEGDIVNDETVLCIIEAMKLMNEIKAETRGKILRVLVENGMPVEFNQPLFVLEP